MNDANNNRPGTVPLVYTRIVRAPIPCPECGRERTEEGKLAVKLMRSGEDGGVSWFKCSACGRAFPLPTRIVEI